MSMPPPPPPPPALSFSSTTDALPGCCTDDFRARYQRGEVPNFGCYDPVYLRRRLASGDAATSTLSASSCFFPPFSTLVRAYGNGGPAASAAARTAATTTAPGGKEASPKDEDDGEEVLFDGTATFGFGRARRPRSWEHVTSADDLWNGPPLTTKIPPAADYERILLDRK